jgi:hypothetical protein
MLEVGVLGRVKFLVQGFEVVQELYFWRTPLTRSVATLVAISFFHPHLKFSTEKIVVVV